VFTNTDYTRKALYTNIMFPLRSDTSCSKDTTTNCVQTVFQNVSGFYPVNICLIYVIRKKSMSYLFPSLSSRGGAVDSGILPIPIISYYSILDETPTSRLDEKKKRRITSYYTRWIRRPIPARIYVLYLHRITYNTPSCDFRLTSAQL